MVMKTKTGHARVWLVSRLGIFEIYWEIWKKEKKRLEKFWLERVKTKQTRFFYPTAANQKCRQSWIRIAFCTTLADLRGSRYDLRLQEGFHVRSVSSTRVWKVYPALAIGRVIAQMQCHTWGQRRPLIVPSTWQICSILCICLFHKDWLPSLERVLGVSVWVLGEENNAYRYFGPAQDEARSPKQRLQDCKFEVDASGNKLSAMWIRENPWTFHTRTRVRLVGNPLAPVPCFRD